MLRQYKERVRLRRAVETGSCFWDDESTDAGDATENLREYLFPGSSRDFTREPVTCVGQCSEETSGGWTVRRPPT